MSRPVSFQRFDGAGTPIDNFYRFVGMDGCNALLKVWARRLELGEYSRIDIRLESGQLVSLKPKKKEPGP